METDPSSETEVKVTSTTNYKNINFDNWIWFINTLSYF